MEPTDLERDIRLMVHMAVHMVAVYMEVEGWAMEGWVTAGWVMVDMELDMEAME
jgi:hypothetical protein